MPSQKPRIALTVDDDLNELLEEISKLTKKPKATIITEFLVDIKPVLTDLRDALILRRKKRLYAHISQDDSIS